MSAFAATSGQALARQIKGGVRVFQWLNKRPAYLWLGRNRAQLRWQSAQGWQTQWVERLQLKDSKTPLEATALVSTTTRLPLAPGAQPNQLGVQPLVDQSNSLAWLQPLLALLPRATPVHVLLSDACLHYRLLPWQPQLSSEAQWLAYARQRFVQLFDEAAHQWSVVLSPARYGESRIACAWPALLQQQLIALLQQQRLTVGTCGPMFLEHLAKAWRSKGLSKTALKASNTEPQTACEAYALHDDGALTVALAQQDQLIALRSCRVMRQTDVAAENAKHLMLLLQRQLHACVADGPSLNVEQIHLLLWADSARPSTEVGPIGLMNSVGPVGPQRAEVRLQLAPLHRSNDDLTLPKHAVSSAISQGAA